MVFLGEDCSGIILAPDHAAAVVERERGREVEALAVEGDARGVVCRTGGLGAAASGVDLEAENEGVGAECGLVG